MPHKDPIAKREYDRLWRLKHPNKVTRKSHKQKLKMYGLTITDFESMKMEQNNKCKICGDPFKLTREPSVDHCHQTGRVRGLLCIGCNTALGQVKDNVSTLIKMIDYLSAFSNS